jgi:hypothetical protein
MDLKKPWDQPLENGNLYSWLWSFELQISILSTEMRIREKRSLTRCPLSPLPANWE